MNTTNTNNIITNGYLKLMNSLDPSLKLDIISGLAKTIEISKNEKTKKT